MSKIMNNIVGANTMRSIQSKTLNELADYLTPSFGPLGSYTCIKKENALSRYTKDGHTIIGAIHYNGIIEQSIKDDIESITRHIVKTIGDGTTSAVILSAEIFDGINNMIKDIEGDGVTVCTADIVRCMEIAVGKIKSSIKEYAEELTPKLVYDIAMISTNGNEFIAKTLQSIYEEFGNTVFIDVTPGLGENTVIKSYNGMTLNTGYCDPCYITNRKNNTCEVDRPEVYFFEDPIDTKEMGVYLDAILSRNIVTPTNKQNYSSLIPTVIFAPTISRDVSSIMDSLNSAMASMPAENRLPVCIITSYHEKAQLSDLSMMCGAKMIRKYIDPKIYQMDLDAGRAPTPSTIMNWAGHCDSVISYSDKTTFIRPHAMFDADGNYSESYNSLIAFIEAEITNNYDSGESRNEIATLKRRLNSLKSNMVELFVGGITQADRDALRDLVEDAVLNIRSAAQNGVGYGANILAASMAHSYATCVLDEYASDEDIMINTIMKIIDNAYISLIDTLYSGTSVSFMEAYNTFDRDEKIYNIRTRSWESNVRSSIMSDIVILDTVSRIITMMATCNQFIVPTALHNVYVN